MVLAFYVKLVSYCELTRIGLFLKYKENKISHMVYKSRRTVHILHTQFCHIALVYEKCELNIVLVKYVSYYLKKFTTDFCC